jgi:hypothetical protein
MRVYPYTRRYGCRNNSRRTGSLATKASLALSEVVYCAQEVMSDWTWNMCLIAMHSNYQRCVIGSELVKHVEDALMRLGVLVWYNTRTQTSNTFGMTLSTGWIGAYLRQLQCLRLTFRACMHGLSRSRSLFIEHAHRSKLRLDYRIEQFHFVKLCSERGEAFRS